MVSMASRSRSQALGVEVLDEGEDSLVRPAFDLVQQPPTLGGQRHDTLSTIVLRDRSPDQPGVLERSEHPTGVGQIQSDHVGDLVHLRLGQ